MLENNTINIYTDGACLGNPGPGGWAYLYYLNDKKVFSSGGEKNTTNNRMELTAAIKSLQNISFFQLFCASVCALHPILGISCPISLMLCKLPTVSWVSFDHFT